MVIRFQLVEFFVNKLTGLQVDELTGLQVDKLTG